MNKSTTAFLTLLCMSAACSKGGAGGSGIGASSSSFGKSISSQFIDAPVKGLSLETEGGETKKTGDNGVFTCKSGEMVTFKLKDFELGSAACGDKIFVHDLTSDESGFTWEKAAAIIQNIAPTNGGVLDLSLVDEDALSFNDIGNYSDVDDAALILFRTANTGVYLSGATQPAVKTVSDAATEADSSLASSAELSASFTEALEELATFSESDTISLESTLISGDTNYCWGQLRAEAKIVKSTVSGATIYKAQITEAASFDDESVLDEDGICQDETGNDCEQAASDELPGDKIITSESFNMISNYTFTEDFGEGDTTVKARGIFAVDMDVQDDGIEFSGIFEQKFTVVGSGQSIECRYEVTAGQIDDEDDYGDDNTTPATLPSGFTGSYSLDAENTPAFCDEAAETMLGGIPTDFNVTINGQSVSVATTDFAGSWSDPYIYTNNDYPGQTYIYLTPASGTLWKFDLDVDPDDTSKMGVYISRVGQSHETNYCSFQLDRN